MMLSEKKDKLRLARRGLYKKLPRGGQGEVLIDLLEAVEDLAPTIKDTINERLEISASVKANVDLSGIEGKLGEFVRVIKELEFPEYPDWEKVVEKVGEKIIAPDVNLSIPDSFSINNLKELAGLIPVPMTVKETIDINPLIRVVENGNNQWLQRFNQFSQSLRNIDTPIYVKILDRDNKVVGRFGGSTVLGDSFGGWQFPTGINDIPALRTLIETSTGGIMAKGDFAGGGSTGGSPATDFEGSIVTVTSTGAVLMSFAGVTKALNFQSHPANDQFIYLGKGNVTSTGGGSVIAMLGSGQPFSMKDYNDSTNQVYAIAVSGSQKIIKSALI